MIKLSRKLTFLLATVFLVSSLASGDNEGGENHQEGGGDGNKPQDGEGLMEPPFPNLINVENGFEFIHIVSEIYNPLEGMQNTEEFIDLRLLRNAFVTKDRNGRFVNYVDGYRNIMYRYKDFRCEPLKLNELEEYRSGLWMTQIEYKTPAGIQEKSTLFGIASIWLNAGKRAKVYEKLTRTSGAANQTLHKWTVEDSETKTRAHLYFVQSAIKAALPGKDSTEVVAPMELETVQIVDTEKNTILKTINVLLVDNVIPQEVRSELLDVPVGYGCHDDGKNNTDFRFPTMDNVMFTNLFRSTYRILFEATATFNYNFGSKKEKVSETINAELLRTNKIGEEDLQMVRLQDSQQDKKVIYNYFLNLRYDIDLKRGGCNMSSLSYLSNQDSKVQLIFPKSRMELNMDLVSMDALFVNKEGFYYIKSENFGDRSLLYFEKSTEDKFEFKRIIRVMSITRDESSPFPTTKLDSVIIRIYNQNFESVTSEYHINIVEAEEVTTPEQLAKLVDVSEECYVNNEAMKSGRDYAWLELSYSVPSRLVDTIGQNVETVKRSAYNLLLERDISVFNAPRLEIELEEDSMVMRILLIDLPPLEFLFEFRSETTFVAEKSAGDLEDLTKDLTHCANLCRLNRCKIFSYSETTFTCLLASSQDGAFPVRKYTKSADYSTYNMPQKEGKIYEDLYRLSLHRMLADLQHKEYDELLLPRMPDEMTLPLSETGITPEERYNIGLDYFKKLEKFRQDEGDKIPLMTFILNFPSGSIAFVPNKIEIEDDPLDDFDLFEKRPTVSGSGDEDGMSVTANFHQALSLHQYKLNNFYEDPNLRQRTKGYEGLSYEQCALACIDRKCSSFSYCTNRKQCVATEIWDVGAKMSTNLIERDPDCFIAQRDFTGKFNKFSGVPRPLVYKKTVDSLSPSECAHACVVETDFNCLAFDFCPADIGTMKPGPIIEDQAGSCFFRGERFISTGSSEVSAVGNKLKPSSRRDCDHYSRSYLADFTRIEYRAIDEFVLGKLRTEEFEGLSVDQCADKCVNDLTECTAFQFCYNPNNSEKTNSALQKCTMIDSKPEGLTDEDLRVVVKQTAKGDEYTNVGRIFKPDNYCHVFSMRKDASEADLRDLALNAVPAEISERQNANKGSGGSLSFGSGCLLFLAMTILFGSLVSALLIARDKSDFVRTYSDRIQTMLRRN